MELMNKIAKEFGVRPELICRKRFTTYAIAKAKTKFYRRIILKLLLKLKTESKRKVKCPR